MLRISITNDSKDNVRVALEGWLTGPWVEELRTHSERLLAADKVLVLDLGKLWFMDATGAALLRELVQRQVSPINSSPFITQQLKETNV